MLNDKIEQFIRKEIRSRVDEKLSKPTPACRECTRRITALEKQMQTTIAAVCPANKPEVEPERKHRYYRITGAVLLKLRERWELTQNDMALLLETTLTSVNRWEREKRKPSPSIKKKIAGLRDLGKRRALKLLKELKHKADIVSEQEDTCDNDET